MKNKRTRKQCLAISNELLEEMAKDYVSDLNIDFGDELTIANYGKLCTPKTGVLLGAIKVEDEEIEEEGFYYCAQLNDIIYKEKNDISLKSLGELKNTSKQASFKELNEDDFIKRASDSVSSESGILSFDINEKDNIIVKRLKELINTKRIRVSTVTSKGFNYNLIYSLMKRNSIDFKTLDKWCEVLNVNFDISFKTRKK